MGEAEGPPGVSRQFSKAVAGVHGRYPRRLGPYRHVALEDGNGPSTWWLSRGAA
jgi:hypothetical protein